MFEKQAYLQKSIDHSGRSKIMNAQKRKIYKIELKKRFKAYLFKMECSKFTSDNCVRCFLDCSYTVLLHGQTIN